MKKLMTMLVSFAMCGAAVAAVNGNSSAAEQIPLTNGKHQSINFVDEYHQGQSALTYTVTNSQQLITGYGKHWVNSKYVTNYNDAKLIAELSSGLGEAMVGINESEIKLIMEERGV